VLKILGLPWIAINSGILVGLKFDEQELVTQFCRGDRLYARVESDESPYMTRMKEIKLLEEDMDYVYKHKAEIQNKFKDIYGELKG
jgi:hypothetical protein